ncbi:ABC transporter permease [Jeotgalibacillus haloalkalitolerans]|uniref:Transport permease protein n=1 Tax=Jeotgalibacillus haloalkalitolerans TaxID=3104292 RepID=A0ABU5KJ58_9BACL|nr:ABC transporter permease [Jeotgalibacillus sp. HH7-29]MDZ5711297.1 ABC transporter permease [Jeotgalibacillus sp. HH7-29]
MKALWTVIKEQIDNFYLIQRLGLFEIKSTNNNNYLGFAWELINPGIQLLVFWFVFGYGIRENEGVDGVPFFLWLFAGLLIWFFVQPSILHGSKSIYTRIKMIAKMSFPTSAIPSFVMMSKFYPHLALLAIAVVIFQFSGFPISVYYLQIPYFMFATIVFVFAINLITSTLATIIRDVQMIVQAVLRMLIYVSPILWVSFRLPEFVQVIMKINPLYYLIEGYRAAFFYQNWYFIEQWEYTLGFWTGMFVLLLIGSMIHVKFRNQLIDFL